MLYAYAVRLMWWRMWKILQNILETKQGLVRRGERNLGEAVYFLIVEILEVQHIAYFANSISKSLSKSHFLNHHLENHLHKNRFLYFFYFPTVLVNLIRTLESHSRLLYLASEKSGIDNAYIWMTI